MSKRAGKFKRLTAAAAAAALLSCQNAYAAASIVSPVADSIVYSGSMLVSVKLSDAEDVKITVYREYVETSPAIYEKADKNNASVQSEKTQDGGAEESGVSNPGTGTGNSPEKEGSSEEELVLVKAAEYGPASAASYTSEDMGKISAGNTEDEKGDPILLSDGSNLPVFSDQVYMNTVNHSNESGIGFYTKQLSGVQPGIYKVCVQSIDSDGKVKSTESSYVGVIEKPKEKETENIFSTKKTGPLQFIQSFLKSLFKK